MLSTPFSMPIYAAMLCRAPRREPLRNMLRYFAHARCPSTPLTPLYASDSATRHAPALSSMKCGAAAQMRRWRRSRHARAEVYMQKCAMQTAHRITIARPIFLPRLFR